MVIGHSNEPNRLDPEELRLPWMLNYNGGDGVWIESETTQIAHIDDWEGYQEFAEFIVGIANSYFDGVQETEDILDALETLVASVGTPEETTALEDARIVVNEYNAKYPLSPAREATNGNG